MDDRSQKRDDTLYERDFYAWTQKQAALMRTGSITYVDIPNIVEELETLGRSELSALISAYRLVSHHLLKLIHQPEKTTTSWESTIKRERGTIEDILEDNPGLKPKRDEAFAKGYARGCRDAANETGIEIARFRRTPPFTREQAETDVWPKDFTRAESVSEGGTKDGEEKPPRRDASTQD